MSSTSHWIPDSYTSLCTGCDKVFSFLTRRHHCRHCGRVFCSQCLSQVTLYRKRFTNMSTEHAEQDKPSPDMTLLCNKCVNTQCMEQIGGVEATMAARRFVSLAYFCGLQVKPGAFEINRTRREILSLLTVSELHALLNAHNISEKLPNIFNAKWVDRWFILAHGYKQQRQLSSSRELFEMSPSLSLSLWERLGSSSIVTPRELLTPKPSGLLSRFRSWIQQQGESSSSPSHSNESLDSEKFYRATTTSPRPEYLFGSSLNHQQEDQLDILSPDSRELTSELRSQAQQLISQGHVLQAWRVCGTEWISEDSLVPTSFGSLPQRQRLHQMLTARSFTLTDGLVPSPIKPRENLQVLQPTRIPLTPLRHLQYSLHRLSPDSVTVVSSPIQSSLPATPLNTEDAPSWLELMSKEVLALFATTVPSHKSRISSLHRLLQRNPHRIRYTQILSKHDRHHRLRFSLFDECYRQKLFGSFANELSVSSQEYVNELSSFLTTHNSLLTQRDTSNFRELHQQFFFEGAEHSTVINQLACVLVSQLRSAATTKAAKGPSSHHKQTLFHQTILNSPVNTIHLVPGVSFIGNVSRHSMPSCLGAPYPEPLDTLAPSTESLDREFTPVAVVLVEGSFGKFTRIVELEKTATNEKQAEKLRRERDGLEWQLCAFLGALSPDVVVVEGGMEPRLVDRLEAAHVAVMSHVGPKVLKKLKILMGIRAVSSDVLGWTSSISSFVGVCKSFALKQIPHASDIPWNESGGGEWWISPHRSLVILAEPLSQPSPLAVTTILLFLRPELNEDFAREFHSLLAQSVKRLTSLLSTVHLMSDLGLYLPIPLGIKQEETSLHFPFNPSFLESQLPATIIHSDSVPKYITEGSGVHQTHPPVSTPEEQRAEETKHEDPTAVISTTNTTTTLPFTSHHFPATGHGSESLSTLLFRVATAAALRPSGRSQQDLLTGHSSISLSARITAISFTPFSQPRHFEPNPLVSHLLFDRALSSYALKNEDALTKRCLALIQAALSSEPSLVALPRDLGSSYLPLWLASSWCKEGPIQLCTDESHSHSLLNLSSFSVSTPIGVLLALCRSLHDGSLTQHPLDKGSESTVVEGDIPSPTMTHSFSLSLPLCCIPCQSKTLNLVEVDSSRASSSLPPLPSTLPGGGIVRTTAATIVQTNPSSDPVPSLRRILSPSEIRLRGCDGVTADTGQRVEIAHVQALVELSAKRIGVRSLKLPRLFAKYRGDVLTKRIQNAEKERILSVLRQLSEELGEDQIDPVWISQLDMAESCEACQDVLKRFLAFHYTSGSAHASVSSASSVHSHSLFPPIAPSSTVKQQDGRTRQKICSLLLRAMQSHLPAVDAEGVLSIRLNDPAEILYSALVFPSALGGKIAPLEQLRQPSDSIPTSRATAETPLTGGAPLQMDSTSSKSLPEEGISKNTMGHFPSKLPSSPPSPLSPKVFLDKELEGFDSTPQQNRQSHLYQRDFPRVPPSIAGSFSSIGHPLATNEDDFFSLMLKQRGGVTFHKDQSKQLEESFSSESHQHVSDEEVAWDWRGALHILRKPFDELPVQATWRSSRLFLPQFSDLDCLFEPLEKDSSPTSSRTLFRTMSTSFNEPESLLELSDEDPSFKQPGLPSSSSRATITTLPEDDQKQFPKVSSLLLPNTTTTTTAHHHEGPSIRLDIVSVLPAQFRALRQLHSRSPDPQRFALRSSTPFRPSGGKSAARFFMSSDRQFLLKQINEAELASLWELWPRYFTRLASLYESALEQEPITVQSNEQNTEHLPICPTTLCQIFGIFKVTRSSQNVAERIGLSRNKPQIFMVMQKILEPSAMQHIYDLKGSQLRRWVADDSPESARQDENVVASIKSSQDYFYLRPSDRTQLLQALQLDTAMLRDADCMDYSLLVGLYKNTALVGLIDFMRKYTLSRKMERLLKSAIANRGPTVQPPPQYRSRFLHFMALYFCPVPEQCSEECAKTET